MNWKVILNTVVISVITAVIVDMVLRGLERYREKK